MNDQMSIASLNTAAKIAGPKPWGKDWVFENMSPETADPKNAQPESAKMDAALEALLSGKSTASAEGLGEVDGQTAALLEKLKLISAEANQSGGERSAINVSSKSELAQLPSSEMIEVLGLNSNSAAGAQPKVSGLSGGEFLGALDAAQAGGARAGAGAGAGMQGNTNGESGGNPSGNALRDGSDLENIAGGIKGRRTRSMDRGSGSAVGFADALSSSASSLVTPRS